MITDRFHEHVISDKYCKWVISRCLLCPVGYGTPRLFNLQPGAGVMLVPNLGEDFIPTPEKVKDHVLLLASGVGITPFRSIAYELLERRRHSGNHGCTLALLVFSGV